MKPTTIDKIQFVAVTIISIGLTILTATLSCECVKLLPRIFNKDYEQ